MSSSRLSSVTVSSTLATSIPTGTISAHIGAVPNTTDDYYVARYLLMAFDLKTNPVLGATLPPSRPADYAFETKGPRIIWSMSIALSVMVIITGLRLGVRMFRRGLMVGLDDVFIIPSVLLAIAWPTLQMCAVIYGGAGKHTYDISYEEYGHFKTLANFSKPVFVSVGFIKLSICFFSRRLTTLTSRTWTIFNNVFLVLLVAYILLALFWTLFQCDPPYASWDPIRVAREDKPFKCISDNIVASTLSVIHVIMDFGLLSVPLIVLWKVRMGWGTRFRLYFVFRIGAMSFIGSVMRQIEQKRLTFNDVLWNFTAIQDWTLVDLTFGVVATSSPILSALIPKSWNSVRGTNEHTTTPYGHSGPGKQRSKPLFAPSSHKMTSISRNLSDSMENNIRTDVIDVAM